MTSSACALAEARKSSICLTGRCRPWAPKRPACHVFHDINALPSSNHHRVPAIGNALHCQSPSAVEHVHGRDRESDRREPQSEQRECREKLSDEKELERSDGCQEPPHPLAAIVLGLHLSPVPVPHSVQHLRFYRVARALISLALLRCVTLAGRSNPPPSHLSHLTPSEAHFR